MQSLTQILDRAAAGDAQAAEQILPVVYDELRQLAAAKLAQEKPGQTLEATALVHEAWLRLVSKETGDREQETGGNMELSPVLCPLSSPAFSSRGHFFAAAAIAMRRILVEAARRKARFKHGGQRQRVELTDFAEVDPDERLLALDEALGRLAGEDAQAAQVVELHHFAGLNHEQVASTLGITVYEARQKWTYARAWLHNALADN
jgi:RNA polymerase sigma factor (sigma-70 family)